MFLAPGGEMRNGFSKLATSVVIVALALATACTSEGDTLTANYLQLGVAMEHYFDDSYGSEDIFINSEAATNFIEESERRLANVHLAFQTFRNTATEWHNEGKINDEAFAEFSAYFENFERWINAQQEQANLSEGCLLRSALKASCYQQIVDQNWDRWERTGAFLMDPLLTFESFFISEN